MKISEGWLQSFKSQKNIEDINFKIILFEVLDNPIATLVSIAIKNFISDY